MEQELEMMTREMMRLLALGAAVWVPYAMLVWAILCRLDPVRIKRD